MGYIEALQTAGANVISYKEFGNYQGSWAALCELNGESMIITGSFGSGSGSDFFEAEFFLDDRLEEIDGKYYCNYEEITKNQYDLKVSEHKKKLSDFGKSYLQNTLTKEIIETQINNINENDLFNEEEKQMLEWCLDQLNKSATIYLLTPNE